MYMWTHVTVLLHNMHLLMTIENPPPHTHTHSITSTSILVPYRYWCWQNPFMCNGGENSRGFHLTHHVQRQINHSLREKSHLRYFVADHTKPYQTIPLRPAHTHTHTHTRTHTHTQRNAWMRSASQRRLYSVPSPSQTELREIHFGFSFFFFCSESVRQLLW